jgi:hypothetical protein
MGEYLAFENSQAAFPVQFVAVGHTPGYAQVALSVNGLGAAPAVLDLPAPDRAAGQRENHRRQA